MHAWITRIPRTVLSSSCSPLTSSLRTGTAGRPLQAACNGEGLDDNGEDLAVSQLAAEDRLRHGCAHHPRSSLLLPRDISGRTSVPPRARSCKRSSSCKDVDTGHGVDMDLVCGHNLAHIESRPVTVFPAHSSDRWGKEASLAQLGAGFIQPFAGGTAMAGRAAKGSPIGSHRC